VLFRSVLADFIADKTLGGAPCTVHFTDLSLGNPTSWQWDFNNDGFVDSITTNPSYTFTKPGNYTVKLKVQNDGPADSLVKTEYIEVFGYATLPFSEHFDKTWIERGYIRDVPSVYWKSTPVVGDNSWARDDDNYKWISIDGGYSPSGAKGTSHSAKFHTADSPLDSAGSLDLFVDFSTLTGNKFLSFWYINPDGTDPLKVSLSTNGGSSFGSPLITLGGDTTVWTKIVVNLGSISSSTGTIRFTAISDSGLTDIGLDELNISSDSITSDLTANFSADVLSGNLPLTVNFTDLSTGDPVTWKWDFNNDGITDATSQNPSHTFDNAGTYSVKLIASKPGSSDSIVKVDYITVTNFSNINVNFSASVTSGYVPLNVNFTNLSTGAITYKWDFNNDGITDATSINASHIFDVAGTYSVKLVASKPGYSDSLTKVDYITVTLLDNISMINDQETTVKVYPNPSNGQVNIQIAGKEHENAIVDFLDLSGKIIISTRIYNKSICSFDIGHLTSGIYCIRTTLRNKVYMIKLIKK
jgi:PKD repeat protein